MFNGATSFLTLQDLVVVPMCFRPFSDRLGTEKSAIEQGELFVPGSGWALWAYVGCTHGRKIFSSLQPKVSALCQLISRICFCGSVLLMFKVLLSSG